MQLIFRRTAIIRNPKHFYFYCELQDGIAEWTPQSFFLSRSKGVVIFREETFLQRNDGIFLTTDASVFFLTQYKISALAEKYEGESENIPVDH